MDDVVPINGIDMGLRKNNQSSEDHSVLAGDQLDRLTRH